MVHEAWFIRNQSILALDEHRLYAPVDDADSASGRPDFAIAVYPGHLFDYRKSALNSDFHFTKDTPPTFIAHAEDDDVDGVSNGRGSWRPGSRRSAW